MVRPSQWHGHPGHVFHGLEARATPAGIPLAGKVAPFLSGKMPDSLFDIGYSLFSFSSGLRVLVAENIGNRESSIYS